MKVHLLFADREMDFKTPVPRQRAATAQDVELESILAAMAQDDAFVHDLARTVLLSPLEDVAAIRYRQQVLADCARHPEVVREVYEIANSATRAERSEWGSFVRSPELVLDRAIRVLTQFVDHLTQLREIGRRHSAEFESPGFQGFFEELERELNDEFFARVRAQLEELEHRGSLLVSAQLGPGNHGARYVLRTPAATRRRWLARLFRARRGADTIEIAGPDETGHRYLSRLREMGINPVANAVARSADHILAYFDSLRHELGFYLGSLALRTQLVAKGMRTCTPDPSAPEPSELRASGLYDPALALRLGGSVVPNDLSADGRELLIITGANQGGKSTLL
ncbi:MAG: MutS-related protein, partial [Thermoplasmata archaeon]